MAMPTTASPRMGPSFVSTVTATGRVFTEPTIIRARRTLRDSLGSVPPSFSNLQCRHCRLCIRCRRKHEDRCCCTGNEALLFGAVACCPVQAGGHQTCQMTATANQAGLHTHNCEECCERSQALPASYCVDQQQHDVYADSCGCRCCYSGQVDGHLLACSLANLQRPPQQQHICVACSSL